MGQNVDQSSALTKRVCGLSGIALLLLCLHGCALGPDPIKPAERHEAIKARLDQLELTPKPSAPISLSEAIARAIRYNLAARVQAFSAVVENSQTDLANMAMIPDLLTNSGYRFRNPEYASFGPNSTQPTIAESQNRRLQDFTFSWSLLDFGISYFRARQQADRTMIAIEQERKARHQITQDTIIAWYRALAWQEIQTEYEPLMARVNKALNDAKETERLRTQDPTESLAYQRDVLDSLQSLEFWKKDLAGSDYALASMIGLKPQDGIIAGKADFEIYSTNLKRSVLQGTALTKRPDVETTLYETRMSKRDAIIALLELAPIPSFTIGNNYDSNYYLMYNQWMALGGQLAVNVAKLARYPAVNVLNTEKIDLARQKAVAVISAALLQVDIAYSQLIEFEKVLKTSDEAANVATKIAGHMRAQQAARQVGSLQTVREELRAFASKVRRDIARNETRAAGARLMASVGVDFAVTADKDIEEVAKNIRMSVSEFRNGHGTDIANIAGADLVNQSLALADGKVPTGADKAKIPSTKPTNAKAPTDTPPLRGSIN